MNPISQIEQAILRLDQATFQIMCNSLLFKQGYKNIYSLGSKEGTSKTTPGTPDTYFYNKEENTYVFVEYTTQQDSIYKKIQVDLEKCLDKEKTGVELNQIDKIIYFYTSSNLSPSQHKNLYKLCEKTKIKLSLIGINELAHDLHNNHYDILYDFLNLSFDTSQILLKDDFIAKYNKSETAAPLDTIFQLREAEVTAFNDSVQSFDIIMLTGNAGVGKTRFALHVAEKMSLINNRQFFCVRNLALELQEDFMRKLDKEKEYIILFDDANEFEKLEKTIEFLLTDHNVKILLTVRNYAKEKLLKEIKQKYAVEQLELKLFSDEEITTLIQSAYTDFRSMLYINRIIELAQGNARIALLAGRLAVETNSLDSINDLSELYEKYYYKYLNEFCLNKNLLSVAGVLAFITPMDRRKEEFNTLLSSLTHLSISEINKTIEDLESLEMIDILNNHAIKFSDQCFGNFVFKYSLYDKKLFSISTIIDLAFPQYKGKVLEAINMLGNNFRNLELHKYIEKEVNISWKIVEKKNEEDKVDFIRAFYPIIRTDTLIYIKNEVRLYEDSKSLDLTYTPLLSIDEQIKFTAELTLYANSRQTSLDLFFALLSTHIISHSDSFIKVIENLYVRVISDSLRFDFLTDILKKIQLNSIYWSTKVYVELFLQLAHIFLKFTVENSFMKKNTFIMQRFPITVKVNEHITFRNSIWSFLLEISNKQIYNVEIYDFLINFCENSFEFESEVLENDLAYIKKIVKVYPLIKLKNFMLIKKIDSLLASAKLKKGCFVEEDAISFPYKAYKYLINDENYSSELTDLDFHALCGDSTLENLKQIIDECFELKVDGSASIQNNLSRLLADIKLSNAEYLSCIEYLINKNIELEVYPDRIVTRLMSFLSSNDAYNLLISKSFHHRHNWLFIYFSQIPKEDITKETVINLYLYLKEELETQATHYFYRDIFFLDKYLTIEPKIYYEVISIILSKENYLLSCYCSRCFFSDENTQKFINRLSDNLSLVADIYIKLLEGTSHFDYYGNSLILLYTEYRGILQRLIDFYLKRDTIFNSNIFSCFWKLEDSKQIYHELFDYYCSVTSSPFKTEYIIKNFLNNEQKKELTSCQIEWLSELVQKYSLDPDMIRRIFSAINNQDMAISFEQRIPLVELFLKHNRDVETFKTILYPNSRSWSGSEVPIIKQEIEWYKSLLFSVQGVDYLEHKSFLEEKIDFLKSYIQEVQIKELSDDRYSF